MLRNIQPQKRNSYLLVMLYQNIINLYSLITKRKISYRYHYKDSYIIWNKNYRANSNNEYN